jgi:two-component system, response regulator PdtaR
MMIQHLKILIVEDEQLIAADLAHLLTDWGYQVVGSADNSDQAVALFTTHQPDLVLVDIQLEGMLDGVDTVRRFNQIRQIPFIFLTGQADFQTIERVKTIEPSAYLLKPFDERHLHISIELALNNFSRKDTPQYESPLVASEAAKDIKLNADTILKHQDVLFIKQNYRFTKIKIEELMYVEADRNHSYLVLKNQKYILRLSLAVIVEKLDHPDIVRVHRSFAINRRFVESFDDSEMTVHGKSIPFTASYRDDFLRVFDVN